MPYKNVDDFELDGPHALAELVTYIAPLTFRRWQKMPEPLAHDQVNLDTLLDWVPGSPIRLKAASASYRRQLGRRQLVFERLSDYVRDALASPRYTMAGIGPAGTMIEVPRELANQVTIDIERNTLSTPDGGMVWRAVVVRSAMLGAISPEPATPRVSRGRKGWQRTKVRDYIDAHYPGGVPDSLKNAALVDELRGAKIIASARTVSRARGRK
jgi:hypothetical protein